MYYKQQTKNDNTWDRHTSQMTEQAVSCVLCYLLTGNVKCTGILPGGGGGTGINKLLDN